MYKALDLIRDQEVISLSPAWDGRLAELRSMAAQGRLVCPGCRQIVRLRAGRRKRRHFAHLHLSGCVYGKQSWEVLEARAVLFEWLLRQHPSSPDSLVKVEIEKELVSSRLPRPVDCWVERHGEPALAYWVIDARLRLEARQAIKQALEQQNIQATWVLSSRLLNLHEKSTPEQPHLLLSPTERDFLAASVYDHIGAELQPYPPQIGQTLHYLDSHSKTLFTYRSLVKIHAPNIFSGRCEAHPLEQIRAHPHSGEFVHPGEDERLAHSQEALAAQEEKLRQASQRLESYLARRKVRPIAQKSRAAQPGGTPEKVRDRAWGVSPDRASKPEYPCVFCGQLTSAWWTTFVLDGKRVCKCKACLKEGRTGEER